MVRKIKIRSYRLMNGFLTVENPKGNSSNHSTIKLEHITDVSWRNNFNTIAILWSMVFLLIGLILFFFTELALLFIVLGILGILFSLGIRRKAIFIGISSGQKYYFYGNQYDYQGLLYQLWQVQPIMIHTQLNHTANNYNNNYPNANNNGNNNPTYIPPYENSGSLNSQFSNNDNQVHDQNRLQNPYTNR